MFLDRRLKKEIEKYNAFLQDWIQKEKNDFPLIRRNNVDKVVSSIIDEIEDTFNGVTCFNAKKVFYTAFAEEYGGLGYSKKLYQYLHKIEEREDWHKFDPYLLAVGTDVLYNVRGEAFRFLAPAYMICSLEWAIDDNIIYNNWFEPFVINLNIPWSDRRESYFEELYSFFTPQQKAATTRWVSYWRRELDLQEEGDYHMCPWEWKSYLQQGGAVFEFNQGEKPGNVYLCGEYLPYKNYIIEQNHIQLDK